MNRLLLIEDDISISESLSYYLSDEGFDIDVCGDIESSTSLLNSNLYDLVLLDINLPDGDGYTYYNDIEKYNIPVIFLTALDDEKDIVKGLDLGVSDYVTKPFKAKELVARINKALKDINNVIKINDIEINTDTAKVYKNNNEVYLSSGEYKLLLIFISNRNKVLSREELLKILWDTDMEFISDNALTVYIKRLRDKIGNDLISTVRGRGYVMEVK